MICEIQALNVLANYKKIAILLISFTVVVAQNTTAATTKPKVAKSNATTAKSTVAQNNSTTATTTPKVKTTGTTTAAVDKACDKCVEVIYDDCLWNKVIPGSKTDFHFEKSGVCPCPGDDKKDKCNVVQRRVRNIPALQAWSACLFLLSICIAGKILTVLYSIIDTINILESLLMLPLVKSSCLILEHFQDYIFVSGW